MTPQHSLTPSKLQSMGRGLVLQLHTVLRTMRLHDSNNRALLVASEKLRDRINQLWAALNGELKIAFVEGIAYLNDVRLRVDKSVAPHVRALQDEFSERGLGGLAFHRPVDAAQLTRFMQLFSAPVHSEEDKEALRKSLEQIKDLAMDLLDPAFFSEAEVEEEAELRIDRETFSLQAYAKANVVVRELLRSLQQPELKGPRVHVVRIVQDLVDIATERVNFALKLAVIKTADTYVANHAANTCVLSIIIGRSLGIDRLDLVDLGQAALYADLGFSLLPPEAVESKEELSEAEREELRGAMVGKLRQTMGPAEVTESGMRRALVIYEHNQPYRDADGSRRPLHPFSRIVAVASAFDALTTQRPWRDGYAADEALRIIREEADSRFDPLVVKALVNALGLYPLGSLVRLSNGALAAVYHNSNHPERFERPWVKLLSTASGEAVQRSLLFDLSRPEHAELKILGFVAPSEAPPGIDAALAVI